MPHKLLIDQNISRKVLKAIANLFEGSNHVVLAGLENKSDIEIFRFAKENGYSAILTNDLDFISISLRADSPKIILLRAGNLSNADVVDLLIAKKESIEIFLNSPEYGILELF